MSSWAEDRDEIAETLSLLNHPGQPMDDAAVEYTANALMNLGYRTRGRVLQTEAEIERLESLTILQVRVMEKEGRSYESVRAVLPAARDGENDVIVFYTGTQESRSQGWYMAGSDSPLRRSLLVLPLQLI